MHDKNPLVVRPVERGDFEQWLPYWKGYQEFYKISLPEEVTRATWDRFFDDREPMYSAVAVDGGRILGFVNYLFHRSTWAQNEFCYLEDLFVAPETRGRQVGKKLIEFVQRRARAKDCGRLYWHTQETNLRAQRLYDWIGEKPGVIEYRMSLA
ncbi:Histone acetyltransferase HPA2 [Labilithrix luteola]|uniref:Histone acetyltransferase HPA2 n=1 Tax=Labilithrix luteola TaxID=1391654 RepID=A0A0K1PWJ8_9BACT|nr:GNAT family N-acetyltransferase [Labilithrix luteola]AKU97892.1 Histone acetyltransferase HPA2 [Labilithrix luteola]